MKLELKDMKHVYPTGDEALKGIDLVIEGNEPVAIIGQNGAGKTTLVKHFNGILRPTSGQVLINGEDINSRSTAQWSKTVGYVFQNFNLFPHLTVLENLIEAPIAHKKLSKKEAMERAYSLLDVVGLRDKADAWSRHLSGGQQQRIAIARALALRPRVMLFDEPTSALDPELVGEVLDVIKKLARSGTTLVVVTHEIGFAREVADQVVFMVDGKIVEQGNSDDVLNRPSHPRTRQFLSKVL